MADYDLTTNLGTQPPWDGVGAVYAKKALVTIPAASYLNNDILKVIPVEAGTLVMQVSHKVVQAGGGTTFSGAIGDEAGDNSYDAAADYKATAGTEYHGAPGTDAYLTGGGKYYSAANTIDIKLTLSGATGTAIVEVTAICAKVH